VTVSEGDFRAMAEIVFVFFSDWAGTGKVKELNFRSLIFQTNP
jgi:hypothetical protein